MSGAARVWGQPQGVAQLSDGAWSQHDAVAVSRSAMCFCCCLCWDEFAVFVCFAHALGCETSYIPGSSPWLLYYKIEMNALRLLDYMPFYDQNGYLYP